jgi:hypothetical protein
MNRFRQTSVADRQNDAEIAKKAALEKYRAAVNAPGLAQRLVARQAVKNARNTRVAERRAMRVAAVARKTAEKAAEEAALLRSQKAAAQAEHVAREAAYAEKVASDLALEVQKRETTDARYAARKEQRRKGR